MPANQPALPPTCEIRDWVVFGPGYWRGALYSPADCQRIAQNFQRVRRYLGEPTVKLGHDREQTLARLRKSSGWLSLGDVTAVSCDESGKVRITVQNLPTEIGRLVNAGRIRSGSVELIPFCDLPGDQSQKLPGPILTAIALLGEEHPAVKGTVPRPKAVFQDGSPVPAETNLTPWLETMAQSMSVGFSDAFEPPTTYRFNGKDYPLIAVAFSEMTPMVDAAFLQSLGLKPDQIDAILAQMGGGTPPPGDGGAAGKPPGGTDAPPPPPPPGPPGDKDMAATAAMPGPAPTPVPDKDMAADDQTMMSAAAFSDFKKRFAAMEAKMSDAQKAADEKCMAAYSDRVELVLSENARRVAPNMRATFKQMGLDALAKRNFAEVTNDGEKAFAAWKSFVESLPESQKFSEAVQDGKPETKTRKLDPLQQAIVNSRSMKQNAPALRDTILKQTQPSVN